MCAAHLLVLEGRLLGLSQVCVAQWKRIRVRSSGVCEQIAADSRATQAVGGDGGTDEIGFSFLRVFPVAPCS